MRPVKGRSRDFLLGTLLHLAVPVAGAAEYLDHPVAFGRGDLVLSSSGGYDVVRLAGSDLTQVSGEPEVPVHLMHLAIPGDAAVESVELVDAEWTVIPGTYRVRPVQEPFVLSHEVLGLPGPTKTGPIAAIYESAGAYPAKAVEHAGSGYLAGVHVAGLRIHPVRYVPLEGSLALCERAVLRVHYRTEASDAPFRPAGELREHGMRRLARRLVANPEALAHTAVKMVRPSRMLRTEEQYDYLLICPEEFVPYFTPLADWKTQKGVKTKILTIEDIDGSYPGIEPAAARVRQAVIDAYANWGIAYVLLGGDTNKVPSRHCFAMASGMMGGNVDQIHADLYFSDLDGDWNANGIEPYGEVADEVDLYADVIVGRFSARNTNQATKLTTKQLTYERNPPTDYETEMLMTGEILWQNPYTDSRISLDWVDEMFIPSRFDPIEKLYESLGNESVSSVTSALNSGKSFWLHDGHGNYELMSVGIGNLYFENMTGLTNGPRYSICYSVACLSAGFDWWSCIAEGFVRNQDGGGVAYVGNNRYGWGSPGNPKYGYSDRLQHKFFETVFVDGEKGVGKALALVKAHYAPQSQSENVYRWHQYSVNLLGDPEFEAWTDTPTPLTVLHPASHPHGGGSFTVTVAHGSQPVEDALVCVTDLSALTDVHAAGRTDATGQVHLAVDPVTVDPLHVTVTAPDHLPYQGLCTVLPSGPYATLEECLLVDVPGGNGNGLLNRGETVNLALTLHNPGTETAEFVTGILRTTDHLVDVLDSTVTFGDIPAGESAAGTGDLCFRLDPSAPGGRICQFELEINAVSGGPWSAIIPLPVAAPQVEHALLAVNDDGGGNGNRRVEPGEIFDLAVVFRNEGTDLAPATIARVSTASSFVSFSDSTADLGDLPVGGVGTALFTGSVSPGCPDPEFITLRFDLETSDRYTFTESTLFVIGTTGFEDDMEGGGGNWTHGGANDLWHLTSVRTHSGTASWYCGRQDTSRYEPDMNAHLESPVVTLAPSPQLTFWLWHDVATYGVDGLYVVLQEGVSSDTLDFIASGGALPHLTIGSEWLQFHYDLGFFGYEAGDAVRLSFIFISDEDDDVGEGYYLDDVILTGTLPLTSTGVDAAPQPVRITSLHGSVPNPFRPRTTVRFSLAERGPARLAVYDVQGRLVRVLTSGALPAGRHEALWDGRNSHGTSVSSGVYFVRLEVGAFEDTKKVLRLK
jgi:hypothetical protein